MLFPTPEFAIFFALTLMICHAVGSRLLARQVVLLAASYVFYAAWDWRFLPLLVFSGLMNWLVGTLVIPPDKLGNADDNAAVVSVVGRWARWLRAAIVTRTRLRRNILIVGIVLNFAVLGTFKYYDFFIENLSGVLSAIGLERDLVLFDILAPVGVSFFTFQGVSYIVDSYRGELPTRPNIIEVLLYISFFPQLVAGPLLRAHRFIPQLQQNPHGKIDRAIAVAGLIFIAVGLFKKMVIAELLATDIVEPVFFDPLVYGSFDLAVATYAYAVQIYCDFSGYTDIAIGVAALLGYRFERNFNLPYRAASVREFWRRWHISLSHWLRDYLYIPLGGSRGNRATLIRNVLITMTLGGLWHGAAWQFVAWGVLHGVVLAAEHLLSRWYGGAAWRSGQAHGELGTNRGSLARAQAQVGFGSGGFAASLRLAHRAARAMGVVLARAYTFHIVCLSWILFRSSDMTTAWNYMAGIARLEQLSPVQYATPLIVFVVLVALLMHHIMPDNPSAMFEPQPASDGAAALSEAGGEARAQQVPTDLWWRLGRRLCKVSPLQLGLGFGAALAMVVLLAPPGVSPFIYFQF